MSTAYNLSEYYIDEPRISGFIVVFVPYGLPPSDLFIHRFFFFSSVPFAVAAEAEWIRMPGECAMYEMNERHI